MPWKNRPEMRTWASLAGALVLVVGCAAPRTESSRPSPTPEQQAELATRTGDWASAARLWSELAWAGGPGWRRACLEAARAFRELDDPDSAEGILELGVAKEPDSPDLHEALGEVYYDMGFRRAAEEELEDALELDPKRPTAWLALAKLRLDLGLEGAALEALDRVDALGATGPEAWFLRGQILRARGDAEGAYEAYRQSFEGRAPDRYELLQAASYYLDPKVRRSSDRARYLTIAWLSRVVEDDPQCSEAWYILGVVQEDRGALERALESYLRAAETDPTSLDYLEALARVYVALDQPERAREMVERALALGPTEARRKRLQGLLEEHANAGSTP